MTGSSGKRTCVTLLTDFGLEDHYVACMKGVILGIQPEAVIVDMTHAVSPGDIETAGFLLSAAYRYFPVGSIHVAVVDPGVGSERRPIVAAAGGHYFVGPDNGLFTPVLEREGGGDVRALENERYHLETVSPTFHGRDIFSPVAAWLAGGVPLEDFGPPVDDLVHGTGFGKAAVSADGSIAGRVVHVDRFGNLVSNISRRFCDEANQAVQSAGITIQCGGRTVSRMVGFYAEAAEGEVVALFGSSGFLEVAVNRGSAAEKLGVGRGETLRLVLESGAGTKAGGFGKAGER